jgi:hypothetical protein
LLALAASIATGATPAWGQVTAEEKAGAESLFRRALGLMERDETAEACPLFEEVVRITGGLGAEFELAKCYEQAGRVASAWALYREVGQRDRGRRAKEAQASADRIEPSLAHLTIEVPATAAALTGIEVRRDGRPLLREAWGVSIPVDPGEHRLEASAGKAHWAAQIALAQGGRRTIVVGPLTEAPLPAPPPAPPPPRPSPAQAAALRAERDPSRGQTQRIIGLSVAGVGLVGVGVGVAFGLEARAKYQRQRDNGDCDVDNTCTAAGDRASKDARSRGNLGTLVGGVGLAALVGGFVLYLTAPSAPPASSTPATMAKGSASATMAKGPSLTWQPAIGPGTASLSLTGRW